MRLLKCADCGKEISISSDKCPNCGSEKQFKNIIFDRSQLVREGASTMDMMNFQKHGGKIKVAFIKKFMKIIGYIFLVLMGLGIIGSFLDDTDSTDNKGLTSLENNVTKTLIRMDFDRYLSGKESSLIKYGLLTLPKEESLYTIRAEYKRNEVNADNLYKGNEYLISSRVKRVNKGMMGGTNLYLQSGGMLGTLASLDSDYNKYTASLRKGYRVKLICEVGSFVMDSVTLNDCVPLNYWLGNKKTEIKNRIIKNYDDKNPDDTNTRFINFAKSIASKLKDNSNCSSGNYNYQKCLNEINSLNKQSK